MDPGLAGRRLTFAALLLSLLAAAAGGRYALLATAAPPPHAAGGEGEPSDVEALLAEARASEGRGDIPAALSAYRRAVAARPGLLDRSSPAFLGAPFGERLKGWHAAMKAGTLPSPSPAEGGRNLPGGKERAKAAGEDASYLFRRMNGGCG